jgi:hypothetical protein
MKGKGQAGGKAKAAADAALEAKRAKAAAKARAYGVAEKAAIAAGFTAPMKRNHPGYWKLVRVFAFAKGIPYPTRPPKTAAKLAAPAPGSAESLRAKRAKPHAAALAEDAKREAMLARKREAERKRRARKKAAKAA